MSFLYLREMCVLVAPVLLLPAIPGFAQTNVGEISGSIYDSTGRVVPECRVIAVNIQTGLEQAITSHPQASMFFPAWQPALTICVWKSKDFKPSSSLG